MKVTWDFEIDGDVTPMEWYEELQRLHHEEDVTADEKIVDWLVMANYVMFLEASEDGEITSPERVLRAMGLKVEMR